MSGQWGDRNAWLDHAVERGLAEARKIKPPAKTHKRTPSDLEHQIQRTFIDWVRIMQMRIPELGKIYAIPNGALRHPSVAKKLKAEGVKAGVPDLHMPVARNPWHSLYMETKVPEGVLCENGVVSKRGELSKYQEERAEEFREEGNVVAVCRSVDALINTTLAYLAGAIIDAEGTIPADWRRDR